MITSSVPNYRQVVGDYIAGAQSGEIVVGELVRRCVNRHVLDLATAHERGWWFDEGVAARACAFFPLCLMHSQGEWAGDAFQLSPWQAFITWVLFGWQDAQKKVRRFRKAMLSIARKNGKTTWAAGLELKQLYHDEPDEPGAQVYCVATKEEQAKLLYSEAVRMIEKSIFLSGLTKIRRAPHVILSRRNDSYLKPLGSDSGGTDGLNPHCVVMDELHAWRDRHRELKEKLSTGGASRRQPLEIIITTAGDASSQLWIEEDEYARNVLAFAERGEVFDDRYFAFIATIDDDDDPLDEKNWAKANPNLGVSVKLEYLQEAATKARNAAPLHNQFVRYHCNARTNATERAISEASWNAGDKPTTFQPGDLCHGGMDLGRTNDWAAAALCFPRYTTADGETTATSWELLVKCWTCSDGRFDVTREPFATWAKRGLLGVCRGQSIEFDVVEQQFTAWRELYQIQTIAYDPTFARDIAQRLQDLHGFNLFRFTQSHRFFNEPMRRMIETELPAGNVIHGGDPVLTWQAGNLELSINNKGEWMPDKANPKNKIDGMVAAIMAFSEALFASKQIWYNADKPMEIG